MISPRALLKTWITSKLRVIINSTTDDLRKSLMELNDDYIRHSLVTQQKIRALEDRIEKLEKLNQ
jgi:adenine C2-methylase RlmN of 23S rRNA A2503 and tRNA A37